jgi:putative ABC transport system permease protein
VITLLKRISARQLAASWPRTILVVGGVAVGVTLIAAIGIINDSILENFRRTIEVVAGPAALEITLGTGEIGFDESALAIAKGDVGVELAIPIVRGTISLADAPEQTLQLFGVDLFAESDLARYGIPVVSDRRELARSVEDASSLLLTQDFARKQGVSVGETIALALPDGVRQFTLRGLLDPIGVAQVFGGQLAIMDLPTAQIALGKGVKIDQIDLILATGAELENVRARLEAALPESLTIGRPEQRGSFYDRVFSSFQTMLTGASLLCLVAGIFIIYNTTSTAAVNRALTMATLQNIGADPSTLFRLLLGESLLLGAIGSTVGLASGLVLAHFLTDMVTDSMSVIFQLRFPVQTLELAPLRLAAVWLCGVGAAVVGSIFAGRRVAALNPLDAAAADADTLTQARDPKSFIFGWALLIAASVFALWLQTRLDSPAWGNVGSTLWFASSILIAIPAVSWIAERLAAILPRYLGAEGRVAAESLARSKMRTGITVAAIGLVLTIAIAATSLSLSFQRSVSAYFSGGFLASDLVVSAVSTQGGWLETPIEATIADEIRSIPGVASVELLRILPGQEFRGVRIAVAGLSDGLFESHRYESGWELAGDPASGADHIINRNGARVSSNFASRFHVGINDSFQLNTPSGPVKYQVVEIVPDYISDRGTVALSRRQLEEHWSDNLVNRVSVFVEPNSTLDIVRTRIQNRFADSHRLKVLSLPEVVKFHDDQITRAFAFSDAIQILIAIVTVAGILDLLLSTILERRREFALWRVIGADEDMVRRSVIVEATIIGVLGTALGAIVGFITTGIWVKVNFKYLLGYHLELHFAYGKVVWYLVLTVAMTALAGWIASHQAVRHSILDGIHAD